MKATHRPDILAHSVFDTARNLDFNGYFLARPDGGVLVDPMEMSDHDRAHVAQLGGVSWIVVTNSDHTRAVAELAAHFGARIAGPAAEREGFPLEVARWLEEGDEVVGGVRCFALDGSKTPGELALWVDDDTAIFGDLVRGHRGGALNFLPDAKLTDAAAARASVSRVAAHGAPVAVLVGDGWPVFREGGARLAELLA